MTTTMINAEIALNKDIGDDWASTTTGAGLATTLVDTALIPKANDWVTEDAYAMLEEEPTGSAAIYDIRKISSLDNTTGTLTVLTFAAAPGTGIDYSVHRLFHPEDKRRALIAAAKNTFPFLHAKVRDETKTTGNWLKNGEVEQWTVATYPDDWRVSGVTATATTTAKLFLRGTKSCKLDTATGYLYQDWTLNDDLKLLRGKNVLFKARIWCDTASACRLAVNDGTTTTYSDYHEGNSAWEDEYVDIYLDAIISQTATDVSFRVYLDNATATAYVDDLRVLGPQYDKVYVGDLSLALDRPLRVSYCPDEGQPFSEPWVPVRNYELDTDYLYISSFPRDYRLRIEGINYLSWSSETTWTGTIAVDEPQLKILTAAAAKDLYLKMSLPNFSTGQRDDFQKAMAYWDAELQDRINKYQMIRPLAKVKWGVGA